MDRGSKGKFIRDLGVFGVWFWWDRVKALLSYMSKGTKG